jgi:hypothetical protein
METEPRWTDRYGGELRRLRTLQALRLVRAEHHIDPATQCDDDSPASPIIPRGDGNRPPARARAALALALFKPPRVTIASVLSQA